MGSDAATMTSDSFESQVLEASRRQPVLVDFWAEWCGPCKALAPILERVVRDYGEGLRLVAIDTDANRELAMANGIRSLPTVRLFRDARPVAEFTGAQPEAAVREFLATHVGPPRSATLEQVRALRAAGDSDQALQLLRARLDADGEPANDAPVLRVELADLLFELGQLDAALDALDALPRAERDAEPAAALRARIAWNAASAEAPDDGTLERRIADDASDLDALYLLSLRRAARGDFEQAMEGLLALVERDRGFRDDAPRQRLVELFGVLGAADPSVARFRARLSSALN